MKPMLNRLMEAVFERALVMAAPAQAADWQTTAFPRTEAVFNTRNNDLVVINGKQMINTRITTGPDGFLRFELRESMYGTGLISATGAKYTYSNRFYDDFQVREQRYVYTNVTRYIHLDKVNSTAQDMDVAVHEELVTDTQTGQTKIIKQEFEAECDWKQEVRHPPTRCPPP
jgi:hypothetical protein